MLTALTSGDQLHHILTQLFTLSQVSVSHEFYQQTFGVNYLKYSLFVSSICMDLLPITHIPMSRWAPDISGGGNTVSISSICISRLGSFVSRWDGPGQPGQPLSFRIRQLHCQLTIVGQIVMYSAKLRRCCRCPDPGILDLGLIKRIINLTKPIHY